MSVKNDDMQNIWVEGSSYWGDNTFTELFTQKILDKEGLLKVGHIYGIKVVF